MHQLWSKRIPQHCAFKSETRLFVWFILCLTNVYICINVCMCIVSYEYRVHKKFLFKREIFFTIKMAHSYVVTSSPSSSLLVPPWSFFSFFCVCTCRGVILHPTLGYSTYICPEMYLLYVTYLSKTSCVQLRWMSSVDLPLLPLSRRYIAYCKPCSRCSTDPNIRRRTLVPA